MHALEDSICAMLLFFVVVWHKGLVQHLLNLVGRASYTPQSQLRTFTARTAIPVPAATPAKAFFAPGSPWAKPYPPITIATRLATFSMVPVKRLWIAVKPVSNGEPCAKAAIGIRKNKARATAVGRAHFD